MSVSFKWKNLQPVNESMEDAVMIAALDLLAGVERRVPVKTGNLANSYNIEERGSGNSYAVYVGTNVHYAPYVEFGTRNMNARQHLRPAFNATKAKYG